MDREMNILMADGERSRRVCMTGKTRTDVSVELFTVTCVMRLLCQIHDCVSHTCVDTVVGSSQVHMHRVIINDLLTTWGKKRKHNKETRLWPRSTNLRRPLVCPLPNTEFCCSLDSSCENRTTNTVWLLTHFPLCCQVSSPSTPLPLDMCCFLLQPYNHTLIRMKH